MTSLGFRTDLALLELGGTQVVDQGDHAAVRSAHNPNFWWGNFLLLDQVPSRETSQRWLDRFHAEFPTARHVALGIDGTNGSVEELSWFTEHGFGGYAYTVMTATAVKDVARTTTEAICRQLHSDADWAQSIELRCRCDEAPVDATFRQYVTAEAETNRRLVEAGLGQWFGAFEGDQLVAQLGLVAAGPGLARFRAVETDPTHRRRGHARALVHLASVHGFTEMGAQTLVMVADPDYFAIELYRALGFSATETQLQLERPPS